MVSTRLMFPLISPFSQPFWFLFGFHSPFIVEKNFLGDKQHRFFVPDALSSSVRVLQRTQNSDPDLVILLLLLLICMVP